MTEGRSERKQPRDKTESQSGEQLLEVSAIFEKLFEVCDEIGFELDPADLEYILGEDENDFLGNIASFALEQLGLDPEVLYERLGIDAEFEVRRYTFGELAQWDSFAQKAYILAITRRRAKLDEQSEA